jgi:hypothetical protein
MCSYLVCDWEAGLAVTEITPLIHVVPGIQLFQAVLLFYLEFGCRPTGAGG